MLIHPYYINKAKRTLEKIRKKAGIISPSSAFARIGVFIFYGMKAGEQAAMLDELHRKLFEPYRLPRLVYAPEYEPVESVVLEFRAAQVFYEDY